MKRSKPLTRKSPLRATPSAKTELPLLRKRKCANCGESFRPFSSMVKWCGTDCGAELGLKKLEKVKALEARRESAQHRAKLADSKPLSHWLALTEAIVHKYIHARDRGLPCISCGTRRTVQWEAGHYLSKGARPELRFVLANINLQCHRCNELLSGNQAKYRIGLVDKIGEAAVQELEGPHPPAKFTREVLAELRKHISALTRELERTRQ